MADALQRRREREVFGLTSCVWRRQRTGSDWIGLEQRPQGQGEVLFKNYMKNQSLAESPTSCGLHGGSISGTSDRSRDNFYKWLLYS